MSSLVMERPGPRGTGESALPPSMVERMTLILDLFTAREVHLTLEQISRTTGLPRSTTHRILDQLVRLDWLEHVASGYALGRRALGIGGGTGDHGELRSAASPYLHDLLLRTGAVIHLGVLEGAEIRYLDKLGGRSATAVPSRVGGSAPAHLTALGKAILAWLEPETVDELTGEAIAARPSDRIASLPALHRDLARVRERRGLAHEQGECFPDIACVAAAIRGPRGPVGAISLVAPRGSAVERGAPLVLDAARLVAEELYPGQQRAWRSSRTA